MDTQPMPVPEGEPPLDTSKDSVFDRHATDRGGGLGCRSETEMLPSVGQTEQEQYADRVRARVDAAALGEPGEMGKPGWIEAIDPQTREVLRAAQNSERVSIPIEVPSSFQQRPYWEAPEWPRNGREVGAWASGVLATLEPESAGGSDTLHVQVRRDHVDGAVTALVDSGARVVRRSSNGRFVTLEVSRNPG